jgi:starch phosphorylase
VRGISPKQIAKRRKAVSNIAGSGKFSSDRPIAQYAAETWDAKPFPVS